MHYGRYGSCYVLDNLDTTHPGTKKELKHVVIKVRRKGFGIGQANDMAGEQTLMKRGKIAGGTTYFASPPEKVRRNLLNYLTFSSMICRSN